MNKNIIIVFLLFLSSISFANNDSSLIQQNQVIRMIEKNEKGVETANSTLSDLHEKFERQANLNEQTLNSISSQLSAASYNITIFGILFTIAAILLGIYVTYIERKIVKLREENKSLLDQTIKNKEEVVTINNLIQSDILGLYEKIKREETVHLLNRLLTVPEDISNLLELLLSRELERDDFQILKKAYMKIKNSPPEPKVFFSENLSYEDSYKLLFFQHFLDLAIKDKDIAEDLIDFYSTAINCAFENDIIKSTSDFINTIIKLGYQSKAEDISSFMKALSLSKHQNNKTVYNIIFNSIKSRNDHFKFFDLIGEDKESRVGKSNYGKMLIDTYSLADLSAEEKSVIDKTNTIVDELEKEEQERKTAEQKKKLEAAKRKKLEDEKALKNKVKK